MGEPLSKRVKVESALEEERGQLRKRARGLLEYHLPPTPTTHCEVLSATLEGLESILGSYSDRVFTKDSYCLLLNFPQFSGLKLVWGKLEIDHYENFYGEIRQVVYGVVNQFGRR